MKLVRIIILALCATTVALADSESVSHIAALAARLDRVEGSAIGDAASPGRFHLLAQLVLRDCRESDVKVLLAHASPTVRLLGYQCALTLHLEVDEQIEKALLAEKKEVLYFPFGCVGGMVSFAQIAGEIRREPRLLLDGPKE